ncbi:MAG: hypothetical protein AAF560_32565 [Acidobacteriota bacterium]
MKTFRPLLCSAVLLLGVPTEPAAAVDACNLGNVPGASLLFPYFEVDLANPEGRSTLISINNANTNPTVVHVILWTNWGLPSLIFDLYLPSQGVHPLNIRDLLAGQLPVTGSGSGEMPAGCNDPLTNPVLSEADVAELRAKHTGQPSPVDGLCYASETGEASLATGFITVDGLNRCSAEIQLPQDTGYFENGGVGLANNRNVLWGDFFLIDPSNDSAQGLEAVPLFADSTLGDGDLGRIDTFYRAYVGYDGRDDRMPLSSRLRTRYLTGGGFDGGTELLVWTEGIGPNVMPVACGEVPFSIAEAVRIRVRTRDLAGNASETQELYPIERILRTRVGSEDIQIESLFGTVELDSEIFCLVPIIPEPPQRLQTWMTTTMTADHRFSVGMHPTRLDDLCVPLGQGTSP